MEKNFTNFFTLVLIFLTQSCCIGSSNRENNPRFMYHAPADDKAFNYEEYLKKIMAAWKQQYEASKNNEYKNVWWEADENGDAQPTQEQVNFFKIIKQTN